MRCLPLVLIFLVLSLLAKGQEKIIRENFTEYSNQKVSFLPSKIEYGRFTFEFRNKGQLVDSSSLVTNFDNDGSLFVGQQKTITELLIKTIEGEEVQFNSFQLSSNHAYSNPKEQIVVRGWRDGKVVTPPVELKVDSFDPPGTEYDFTLFQGFEKVDEVKISGEDLQFTLESFSYTNATGQVAREEKKEGDK